MIIKLGRIGSMRGTKGERNKCNKFRSVLIVESLMIWTRVQSFFWSFTWRSFPIVGSLCPPGQLVRMSPFIGQGWARLTQSFRRDFWPHQYMRRSFVLLNSWFAYETTFNTSIEGDKNIFLGRPTSVWKRENWNIPKPEKPRETGQNNWEIPPKTTREHQRK